MGDPKKIRKKYDTPRHPWIKSRIEEEKRIRFEFGTRSKKEIWKMETILKNFKSRAKTLIILRTQQSEIETKQLFSRVKELGLVTDEVTFDNILGLNLDNIMDRRLQTIVFKKGLARSVKQARQFIVHEHILVNGKKITSPSYIVPVREESSIQFKTLSSLNDENHPERVAIETKEEKKRRISDELKAGKKKKEDEELEELELLGDEQ